MKLKHIISPIAGMALASMGLLTPLATHAQYVDYSPNTIPSQGYPYGYNQFRPTVASEITGSVAQNIGTMVLVRSGGQDTQVFLTRNTQIVDRNNTVLGSNALDIGTLVKVVGLARSGGIVASTIIVLSGPNYPFNYGYPTPIIVQPYEYLLPWDVFVRRHPHDWQRWRGHWEGRRHDRERMEQTQGSRWWERGDRDHRGGQSRDWDRDRDGRQSGPPVTPSRHRALPL